MRTYFFYFFLFIYFFILLFFLFFIYKLSKSLEVFFVRDPLKPLVRWQLKTFNYLKDHAEGPSHIQIHRLSDHPVYQVHLRSRHIP